MLLERKRLMVSQHNGNSVMSDKGQSAYLLTVALLTVWKKLSKPWLIFAIAALSLNFSIASVHAADGPAGPGWLSQQGTLVSPKEAESHYKSLPKFSAQAMVAQLATTPTSEITALARSLKNDPRLIYEYVRNNVDYVPYFGSLKGATLTYLDGSGNDFDQASLMIALLRASGFTAQYVYGTMSIPATGGTNQQDMQHWLKVDANNSVIGSVLGNGGIPASAGTNWTVTRVWVQATISGATYLFDPAFKPYQTTTGINLQSAMGYSKTAFLSAAGGTVGTDYVQSLNETGLKSAMDGYTMNLANYIRTNYPNAQTQEVIGGNKIIPQSLTTLPTSLTFSSTPQYYWTDIPDTYVHKVRIKHGGIDQTLNIPDLAGQKLSIVYRTGTAAKAAMTTQSVSDDSQLNRDQPVIPVPSGVRDRTLPKVSVSGASIDGSKSTEKMVAMATTSSANFGSIYPASAGASSSTITWGPMTNPNSVTVQVVVTLTSNPNGAFTIVSGAGTNNLAPGKSLSVPVKFSNAGQVAGTKTGQLHIQWFYNGKPIANADNYYNLTGYVANAMSLAGNGWNFQQVFLNTPTTGSARLTNNGTLPLSVTAKTLTGTNAARFQFVSGNTATTIAAGANQDIQVKYLADVIGSHTAKINMGFTYDGLSYTASDVLPLQGQTVSLPIAQLWLDDVMLMEEPSPVVGTNLNTMTVSVTHPYSATFADQSADYTLKRGSTYAIVYDFGGSRLGRVVEKRERQMQAYRTSGLADTTRQVLTESLNVIGMTWMRDTTLNDNLLSQIAGVIDLRQHRFGVVAQETGYYIDVKVQLSSTTSIHGDTAAKNAYFMAINHLTSAMEHGVLEQMQTDSPAVSTVKLLQLNNANGKKAFMVNSANFATIKPQLSNYSTQDLTDFQTSVTNGNTLILPENGKIALQSWAGKGYIDFKASGTSQHVGMIIGGGYNGGYGVFPAMVDTNDLGLIASLSISQPVIQPKIASGEPVDMATGYWMYNNTDLALTGGTGLAFKRAYYSGSNNIKDALGYGWSHNYRLYVEPHSSSPIGLGQRQPVEASALIAASVATLDLMNGTPDLKSWVTSALIGKWGMDNLTNNAASVHLETDVLTYIKLPNGTFASPPGTTSTLVKSNNLYRVDERFNRTLNFGADNNASTITDADGNTVSFTYSSGKLQKVADSFNHSLTFAYTGALLTSVTDSASRVVSFGYDANNNLTSYTDPESKVWSYDYDSNHRVLTLKNPLNITTVTNVYDSLGQVQSQSFPRQSGNTTYNLYFSGYRNIEEDAAGHQTIYYFDDQKHLVGTENALKQKSIKSYDGQNHVVKETDPKLNTTSYLYDINHNLTKVTNPLGKYFTNTYDSLFHLTDVTDPLGHSVHTDFNSKHHPIKKTVSPANGQSISTQMSYTANGLVSSTTDGTGIVTALTQDSRGNPASSKTATAPAINYVYDLVGRMSSLTDQVGSQTTFIYDKRNLLTSSTDPLGKSVSLSYYDDGALKTITDRKSRTTTFTYTPTGKPNTVAYQSGATVTYTYDQNDNLTQMQDSIGASTYTYDAVNRITSSTDPRSFAISYLRDVNGNITKITYPGNKTVSYTYDALNRIKTVSIDWLAKTATYNYDDAGRMSDLTLFNGTYTQYSYDNANRLTALNNRVSSAGNSLATYSFTLDANGNRTGINQTAPLAITATSSSTAYTMNAKKNRLVQAGTTAYTYDNEGQLATQTGATYIFDDAHRLTSTTAGTVTNTYRYNGAGDRLEATRNGVVTRYIYDANGNLLAEANGSNVIQKYYIYGDGLLAMVTSANALYCYHYDGTGHTVALTDASAAMVNKYAYTPFGKIANQVEAVAQPFKYAGKFGVMAEPNGHYYMRARYYDPSVGRFISEDPSGFEGGDVNLMAYVKNNPVMGVDPTGLLTAYYGGSAAAYYGNSGNVTAGAGAIAYSNETGWFGGNYYTYGAEKISNDIRTTVGAGAGAGPVAGFFTGPLSGFKGETDNLTVEAFGAGITYSVNDSGWGLSVSAGGKGEGIGYYINTTNTAVISSSSGKRGY